MRNIFLLLSLFCATVLSAQDKIYLNDNSVVHGKVTEKSKKSVKVLLADQSQKSICKKDIAIVVYESGYSEVMNVVEKEKKEFGMSEWMIGTNILQPLAGMGGFIAEKNFTDHFSLRVAQSFYFSRYYGFESQTSLLNNFYIGKGRVKWMNSAGVNINYVENPYIFSCFPYENLVVMDMFAPYPQNGFSTYLSAAFTFGTGMHVDVTRHFALSLQYNIAFVPFQWGWDLETDMGNSGISLFYKF